MYKKLLIGLIFVSSILIAPETSLAATLQISPSTGVYTSGTTFSVRAVLNTSGASVNAAEGSLRFNPRELSVVSIDRSSSIFNLWVTEPTFSNSAGTISFSGGLPSGYTGSAGTIFTITFRTVGAATARLSYTDGAVLANDGRGTNIVSGMNGATYTVQAPSLQPQAEVIEYVATQNTPAAPKITSTTHPDSAAWSKVTTAVLEWAIPEGVTEVRTLLDQNPTSVPTRVYESPISTITLSDLRDGVSYFHLQFRNEEGWGRVSHYRLAVDTTPPESFTPRLQPESDLSNPVQVIALESVDASSLVQRYMVRIDNADAYEYIDTANTKQLTLPTLTPGYHTILIEAFDQAGNSIVNSLSFTILSFEKPEFTKYPTEINEEVIPVLYGQTRPNASVEVTVTKIGTDPYTYTVTADESGLFTFIPESTFTRGVYELVAVATDSFGAISEPSERIRIAVERPGYIQIGEKIISILSVIIPLVALSITFVLLLVLTYFYIRRLRKKVSVESHEAVLMLAQEFTRLASVIEESKEHLRESKKTKKLTVTEEEMFTTLTTAIKTSQSRVEKEVKDVESIVGRTSS